MFHKPKLQGQLDSIEQAANAYFNEAIDKQAKKASGWRPGMEAQGFSFDDLEDSDKPNYSEISHNSATVVGELLGATADSSLFDESDRQALRDGWHRADAALRFRSYRRWNTHTVDDEDRVLGVVRAGQAEDPIFSVPHARDEFNEGLGVIGQILTRIPDQAQGEIKKASVVDTKAEDWKRKLESKASFTIVEAARIANETERSLRNKTDKRGRPGPLKLNRQGRITANSLKAYLLDER